MVDIWDWRNDGDGSLSVLPKNPSFEETQALFKFEIDTSLGADKAGPGELYWALRSLYLREGPSTVIPHVYNEDGKGMSNMVVFRRWPGAPQFSEPVKPAYFSNGVGGFTSANGDIGFGLGTDDYVGDNGGAGSVWVSAHPIGDPQWSDCMHKMGMLGGTNHFMPHPIFQLTRKGGSVDPPVEGEYKLANVVNGQIVGWLTFVTPGVTDGNYLSLYKGDLEVGRLNWQPISLLAKIRNMVTK